MWPHFGSLLMVLATSAAVLGCPSTGVPSGPLYGGKWVDSCHACLKGGCAFVWKPSATPPASGTAHTYAFSCESKSMVEHGLQAAANEAKQRAYYQYTGDCRDERERKVVEPTPTPVPPLGPIADDWMPPHVTKPSIHAAKEQEEAVQAANKQLDAIMKQKNSKFECTPIQQGKVPSTLTLAASPLTSKDQYFLHGTTTQGLTGIASSGLRPQRIDKLPELGAGFYTASSAFSGVSVMATIHRRCDRTEHSLGKDKAEVNGVRQFGDSKDKSGPIIGIFRAKNFWDEDNTMLFHQVADTKSPAEEQMFPYICAPVWAPGDKPSTSFASSHLETCKPDKFPNFKPKACYFAQLDGSTFRTVNKNQKQALFTADRSDFLQALAQMKINEACYSSHIELVGYFKFDLSCANLIRQFGYGPGLGEKGGPADWKAATKMWSMIDKCMPPNTI